MAKNLTTSFVKELVSRRVPQVVIGYLLAVAGLVPFVDWTVNRYMLSPHLTDLVLLLFVCTFPSVALIAYFHGKPGKNQWQKLELVVIPANVVITILVLFMLFGGKNLGATAKKITVQNEEGKEIERIVPKSEFRQSLAVFFFENKSGDKKLDWLQYSLPFLVTLDINQDLFVNTLVPYLSYQKVKDNGFKDGLNIPLALKKKIATFYHQKHFLSGTIKKENKNYNITLDIYETATGQKKAELIVTGPDIFKLTDDVSYKIKKALDIPERYIKKGTDLPVSEISTQSIPALKDFIKAINITIFQMDMDQGLEYLDRSIEKDPAFAIAMVEKMGLLNATGQGEKVLITLQKLMRLLYKLPERLQFIVKIQYYTFKKDISKQIPIAKMWVELYPQDITAHEVLAGLYNSRGEYKKGIGSMKKLLELSPDKYDYYHNIGDTYQQMGNNADALLWYKKYADALPEDFRSHTKIGDFHRTLGEFEEAKKHYDKALLLESGNVSVMLKLAIVSIRLGQFEEAEKQYRSALSICQSPRDRVEVHRAMHAYFALRGQYQQALNHLELRLTTSAKFQSPLENAVVRWSLAKLYVENGKKDILFQSIKDIRVKIEAPYDKIIHFGNMCTYLALDDADNAELYMNKLVEEFIEPFKSHHLMIRVYSVKGKINELRGRFKEAVEDYKKVFSVDSTQFNVYRDIARCYFKMEDNDSTREYILKMLKIYPMDPRTHVLAAQLFQKTGDLDKARQHLDTALKVWETADRGFKPAKQALELKKKLSEQ